MKKNIVVIEDEEYVRENLLLLLEEEGYEVIGAGDGATGLEEVVLRKPDLVICDLLMPEMNGFEVLQNLQKEGLGNIPFIFLTAKSEKEPIRQGMDLGADDYITKPYTRAELLNSLATRIEKVEVRQKETRTKIDKLNNSLSNALPQEVIAPLSSIIYDANRLTGMYYDLNDTDRLTMLGNILDNALRLKGLAQNFLLRAELELISTDMKKVENLKKERTSQCTEIIMGVTISKARYYERRNDLILDLAGCGPVAPLSEEKLAKITVELVDNAFRYSEKNTPVKVSAFHGEGYFQMEVINTGVGMKPEQIKNINPYLQFDRNFTAKQGQGLALVKRLVEMLGGGLEITSTPGNVTSVRVALTWNGE